MVWFRHPDRALDAFLDGELQGSSAERVTEHVAGCALCQGRILTTVRIRRALRSMVERARS